MMKIHSTHWQRLKNRTRKWENDPGTPQTEDFPTEAGRLRDIRAAAEEVLRKMKLLFYSLYGPALGERGLAGALRDLLETVGSRARIRVRCTVEGRECLDDVARAELYAIAQTAITNAAGHAQPESIRVRLVFDGNGAALYVEDDGPGFDADAAGPDGGRGILEMRERAERIGACFDIESARGAGTLVTVRLPAAGTDSR